jgi:hypothetical protein
MVKVVIAKHHFRLVLITNAFCNDGSRSDIRTEPFGGAAVKIVSYFEIFTGHSPLLGRGFVSPAAEHVVSLPFRCLLLRGIPVVIVNFRLGAFHAHATFDQL